jgi:hypothetical protein
MISRYWSASVARQCFAAGVLSFAVLPLALAQPLDGPPADPRFRYSTASPPGVAIPDSVETRLGTLRFRDGFPDAATTDALLDNLDFQRAVQAYLLALPAVNMAFNRDVIRALGPVNATVPIFENLLDSRSIFLTPNNNTTYTWIFIDLSDGPLVVTVPPGVLGAVDDMWYRWVIDVGVTGPDKGKGGSYLFLPPGYQGDVPAGEYAAVVHAPTYNLWVPWRTFLVNGDPKPGVDRVKTHTRIHPPGAVPGPMTFLNLSGVPLNTVAPSGYRYWELLNEVVQTEPQGSLDEVRLGYFAAIGIAKGQPFSPDDRMKAILTEAAAVGDATARAVAFRMRDRSAYYYEQGYWQLPFVGGYRFQSDPGVLNLDGSIFFFFLATGVTPAMEQKMVGAGSQYAWTGRDAKGAALDGGATYRLRLPPKVPVKDFWSVIPYSNQTRAMIQTDQRFPGLSSQRPDLIVNSDGSVDIWFGPAAPDGMAPNWVQTVEGTTWNVILRLYGPLEPWFDKSWRPGEIERVR